MHNALTNGLQDGKLSWDQACGLSRAGLQKFLRSELGNGLDEEQAKRFDKYGGSVLTLITIDELQHRFGLERVKAKGLFSRIDALRKHSEYLAKSKPRTEPIRRKRRRDATTTEFDSNLEAGIKRILCDANIATGERSSLVLHSANSDASVKQVRHTPYRYLMGLPLDQRRILRGTTFSEYEPAIKADPDYWEPVAENFLDKELNRLTTAEDSDSDSDSDEPRSRRSRNWQPPVAPNIEDYILDEEQVTALQLFRDAATNNGLARPATLRDILTLFAEVAKGCYGLFETGDVGTYDSKLYERRLKVEAKGTIAKLRRAKDSLFKHCASPNRAETQEEHEAYIARHPRPQKPSKPRVRPPAQHTSTGDAAV